MISDILTQVDAAAGPVSSPPETGHHRSADATGYRQRLTQSLAAAKPAEQRPAGPSSTGVAEPDSAAWRPRIAPPVTNIETTGELLELRAVEGGPPSVFELFALWAEPAGSSLPSDVSETDAGLPDEVRALLEEIAEGIDVAVPNGRSAGWHETLVPPAGLLKAFGLEGPAADGETEQPPPIPHALRSSADMPELPLTPEMEPVPAAESVVSADEIGTHPDPDEANEPLGPLARRRSGPPRTPGDRAPASTPETQPDASLEPLPAGPGEDNRPAAESPSQPARTADDRARREGSRPEGDASVGGERSAPSADPPASSMAAVGPTPNGGTAPETAETGTGASSTPTTTTGPAAAVAPPDTPVATATSPRAAAPGLAPEHDPAEFVDRLSQAVRQSHDAGRTMRVRLHPPELGALQIEVAMRDGTLSARLEVQTPAAQRAVLDNLAQLRETLAQHGTVLDRIDVQLADSRTEDGRPDSSGRRHRDTGQHGSQHRQRDGSERQPDPDEHRPAPQPGQSDVEELDVEI